MSNQPNPSKAEEVFSDIPSPVHLGEQHLGKDRTAKASKDPKKHKNYEHSQPQSPDLKSKLLDRNIYKKAWINGSSIFSKEMLKFPQVLLYLALIVLSVLCLIIF